VSVEYLDLVDYRAIAAEVTGLGAADRPVTKLHLADSGLHARGGGFGAVCGRLAPPTCAK